MFLHLDTSMSAPLAGFGINSLRLLNTSLNTTLVFLGDIQEAAFKVVLNTMINMAEEFRIIKPLNQGPKLTL